MASILRMPGISADAEEAVLLEWTIEVGHEFHPGDLLATVETEKANVDIESDQDAVLWRVIAEAGALVAVGAPIAVLLAIGESAGDEAAVFASLGLEVPGGSAAPAEVAAAAVPAAAVLATGADAGPAASTVQAGQAPAADLSGRQFASPLARRIAREHNIDIAQVEGVAHGTRVVRADVERAILAIAERASAAAAPQPTPKPAPQPASVTAYSAGYTDIPHSGTRRAVARFLTQSKRDAPHFYLNAVCRMDALLAMREQLNVGREVRLSINDFVVKAVARALVAVPEMNAIWMDDAVRRYDSVDISVAIGSAKGLVTPVIRGAEKLSLSEISGQVRDFAARANEGRLKQNELEGGAFTVTNLGMFGVESFAAIINPPQAGILAVGAVTEQAIVVDGQLAVGRTMAVTVSVDHRPVDGVIAAQWLRAFTGLIESPLFILA